MFEKYAEAASEKVKRNKISLSFKFIDHDNDHFFMHGLSKDYYKHLTHTLDRIQSITEDDLRQQKHTVLDLAPKSINFHKSTQKSFPINEDSIIYSYIKVNIKKETGSEDPKDIEATLNEFIQNAFEIMLAKGSGRIHGFIYSNIFYIVWFDPAHNLFLTKHMGKPGKLDLPHEIEKLKPICPTKYQEYNKKLEEVEGYIELLIEEDPKQEEKTL